MDGPVLRLITPMIVLVCLWLAVLFARLPVGPAMNAQLGRTALLQVLIGALLVAEHLA